MQMQREEEKNKRNNNTEANSIMKELEDLLPPQARMALHQQSSEAENKRDSTNIVSLSPKPEPLTRPGNTPGLGRGAASPVPRIAVTQPPAPRAGVTHQQGLPQPGLARGQPRH
ncbi:hypothetical protein NDU88_005641 [Pleurodeles waltl]|uniref:Uncharacterized protein n=1 Tax=Pleurodeles waltl TaxID=8319 RepID=A0AAV7MBU1_PLEWA|nr:hypothetical protein NDU88_005641 [Pleurodeles waltl]